MVDANVTTLLENPDPVARSRAHRTLAERAERRDQWSVARIHYREALELDPTDEVARAKLITDPGTTPINRGFFSRIFG